MKPQIILGAYYHDKVTGFHGTAMGIVDYFTGCSQALLVPKVDDSGKLQEAQWFDIQRLVRRDSVPILSVDNSYVTGFDKEAPKR